MRPAQYGAFGRARYRGDTVQILVQGRDAGRAAAELVTLSEGAARLEESATPKDHKDPLTVAASVIGIVAGSVAVAEQLVRWCRRWREGGGQGASRSVERIVVVVGDRRLLLENLDTDDLERLFRQEPELSDGDPNASRGTGPDVS